MICKEKILTKNTNEIIMENINVNKGGTKMYAELKMELDNETLDYKQSAYSLPDEEKRIQEIRPFRKIDDSLKNCSDKRYGSIIL